MWVDEAIDWTDDEYLGHSGIYKVNVRASSNQSMAASDVVTDRTATIERVVANNKYLFTDGTVTKRGTLRTFQPLRSKDEKNNLFKFNEINENFYDPRKSRFPGDEYDYTNREKGFFNRITLYPKWEEFEQKILRGDDLNPYSTNWPSHFLKIGYSSGFYYDDYMDGVPILRLKRIKEK